MATNAPRVILFLSIRSKPLLCSHVRPAQTAPLVRMIGAVFYSIAYLVFRHASPCLTLELIEAAIAQIFVLSVRAFVDPVAMPRQRYTPFLGRAEIFVVSTTFGAIVLVPMILAIRPAVALPDARNASS